MDLKYMNIENLETNDEVLFYCDVYGTGEKTLFAGNVIRVSKSMKKVDVCYLEGHHSRNDFIPYEDMINKADRENGIRLKVDNYRGPMILFNNGYQLQDNEYTLDM